MPFCISETKATLITYSENLSLLLWTSWTQSHGVLKIIQESLEIKHTHVWSKYPAFLPDNNTSEDSNSFTRISVWLVLLFINMNEGACNPGHEILQLVWSPRNVCTEMKIKSHLK